MHENATDEEIIISSKSGNQEAFKNLINRYSGPLFNFAARLTNRDRAVDIVQDTFIKAWKSLSSFDANKASFKTWIFTIARNTVTDYLRKKKSVQFSDLTTALDDSDVAANIPDDAILPDIALQKLEDEAVLNNVLLQLRPNYREILLLHYQEEMTFDEIGKVLNKPLNTVKSQHRRAVIELREKLANI